MSELVEYKSDPFCDFCGRRAEHTSFMVVSQRTWRACICAECVAAIAEMLADKMEDEMEGE